MVGHCALDVQYKTESVHAVAHGQALTSEHDIDEVMHYIVKKHIGSNRAVHLFTFSFRPFTVENLKMLTRSKWIWKIARYVVFGSKDKFGWN